MRKIAWLLLVLLALPSALNAQSIAQPPALQQIANNPSGTRAAAGLLPDGGIAPRRYRATWGPPAGMGAVSVGAHASMFLAIPIPADAVAVRMVYAQASTVATTVSLPRTLFAMSQGFVTATTTATFASGATTITVASATRIARSQVVNCGVGSGLVASQMITAISGTSITLGAATTAAGAGVTCTFTDYLNPQGVSPIGAAPTWQPITWTNSGADSDQPVFPVTTTGTWSAASSTVTVALATGIVNGMSVVGSGIPEGTTATISGTTVTLSSTTTGASSGAGGNIIYFIAAGKDAMTVPAYSGGTDANTGAANVPQMYYSDFVPSGVPATTPTAGIRVLMIRTSLPAQTFNRGAKISCPLIVQNPAINNGFDQWGSFRSGEDHTTVPDVVTFSSACSDGQQPWYAVQFLTLTPVVQIQSMGDSHYDGTGATGGVDWVYQAALLAGTAALPVYQQTSAWGGQPSNSFYPRARNDFAVVQPSILVMQSWTANDGTTTPNDYNYWSRIHTMAQRCRLIGCVPVVASPGCRDAATQTGTQLAYWLDMVPRIKAMGVNVFDATTVLCAQSAGAFTGVFLPGYSNDNVHPNDVGNAALKAAFLPQLKALIGAN